MKHLQFAITAHPGWFAIVVTGRYDLDDAYALIRQILDESVARDVRRALVDLTQVEGDIPDWERFLLGKETSELLGTRVQVAAVAPADKINYFWENVAVNRGARVGVFPAHGEAEQWLLRGVAPAASRKA